MPIIIPIPYTPSTIASSVYTVQNVLSETREVLQDLDPNNVRYPTSQLVEYINDAVFQARRIRPDIFVSLYLTQIPLIPTTLTPDSAYAAYPFPMPDIYFLGVVNFVIGRAEIRDDEFALDSRAMTFMQSWESVLNGSA